MLDTLQLSDVSRSSAANPRDIFLSKHLCILNPRIGLEDSREIFFKSGKPCKQLEIEINGNKLHYSLYHRLKRRQLKCVRSTEPLAGNVTQ